MRSFDDIAQAAGWSEAAQIDILLDYIGNQGADSEAALAEYEELKLRKKELKALIREVRGTP